MLRLFFIFLISGTAFADYTKIIKDTNEVIVVEVQQSYLFGDGDTKIDARNFSIQEAKVKASEVAGSFIKSNRVIVNDQLKTDTIQTISTALLSSKVKSEELILNTNQQLVFSVVLVSELDKLSFYTKLDQVKFDHSKVKHLELLKAKNNTLQNRIDELNRKINDPSVGSDVLSQNYLPKIRLIEERGRLFSDLVENQVIIKRVFNRGELSAIARSNISGLALVKKDIHDNFFRYIINNAHISLSDPYFKKNKDGTYDAEVEVLWDINERPVLELINKYFWSNHEIPIKQIDIGQKKSIIEISKFYNEKKRKNKYSFDAYEFISSKSLSILVSMGNHSVELGISGIEKSFMDCNSKCYRIQTSPKNGNIEFGSNPVVIKNIPSRYVDKLTSVQASVVVK